MAQSQCAYRMQANVRITGSSKPQKKNPQPQQSAHSTTQTIIPSAQGGLDPQAAHRCRLCNRSFENKKALNDHLGTKGHRVQQAVALLKRQGALNGDQGGVKVTEQGPATGLQIGQVHNI